MWYCPSATFFCVMDPLQTTVSARKTPPAWAPLQGLQLLLKFCSCMGSPWAAASPRAYPHGFLHRLQCELFCSSISLNAGGQPLLPRSFPKAAGAPLLKCVERFLLLLHWLWSLQCCFSHILLAPFSHSCYTLFFTFSQVCCNRDTTSIWPVAGLFCSWLEPSGMGADPGLFSE